MITAKAFAGKHYAVLGLARSGLATVEALLASGARVTAWDDDEGARAKAPIGTVLADLDSADLSQFDSLVVSPGVPLNRHPIAARASEAGVEIIGGLFVLEAVSVVVQVFWFKRFGRRVFKMAPIHHHFEHLGWSEPTVVIRFWIISFILALAGLSTLKLR